MHFLLDTSAMAKQYIHEPNSDRVRALIGNREAVTHVAVLVRTELTSTLARRVREGLVGLDQAQVGLQTYLTHERRRYRLVRLTTAVQVRAEALLWKHPLRAADAIHLACAQTLLSLLLPEEGGLTFVTADQRQAEAAQAEGMVVEYVGA